MILELLNNGQELMGSDGVMYIDGRKTLNNIHRDVVDRNKRFSKNFPHKIATAFKYKGTIINI